MSEDMQRVATLAFVEDNPWIVAKLCALGADAGDPDVGVEVARVANGAFHSSKGIQEAFVALAKAIVAFGAEGVPGVKGTAFTKDKIL